MDHLEPLDPTAIDKLFAKDPETLTDADIDHLISTIRVERDEFKLKQKKAPGTKRTRVYKSAAEAAQVSLGDLDIDLGDLVTNK